MSQIPAAVDYERTLVLAIEVSNKNWVLAAQVPGQPQTKESASRGGGIAGGLCWISRPRAR
jgi:hypothetical protein